VLAVDVDPVAVEVTRENAERNHVTVEAAVVDALADELPPADAALANVALDVVERILPRLDVRRVVTSGYLDRDRPDVAGWRPVDRRERDGWAADLLERELS
jgi:ribosomal protein L11 methylase PrmA